MNEPVICRTCWRDMAVTAGCDENTAYRWGTEPIWAELDEPPADRCRDCAARLLEFHHPGCCVAHCAECDDQWLQCRHAPEPPDGEDYEWLEP